MNTSQRNAIKAIGGQAYADLLAYESAARAKFYAAHPEKIKKSRAKARMDVKGHLCTKANWRARAKGLEGTITPADLAWPTRCPVLDLELDYTPRGQGRNFNNPANPSLDRWDLTRGYVPGNVFVISYRANTIKNNATWQELHAVMTYARGGPDAVKRGRFPKSFRRYSIAA